MPDGSYGPARTRAGEPCPVCPGKTKRPTVNSAVLPRVDLSDPLNPRVIHPHEYAVCVPCHRKQFRTRYGVDPC